MSPNDGALSAESAAEVDLKRRSGRVWKARRRKPSRSRPETSLMRWKLDEVDRDEEEEDVVVGSESEKRCGGDGGRPGVRKDGDDETVMVSARKLAAGIWKSQSRSQDRVASRGGVGELGFQLGDGHGGSMDFFGHGNGKNVLQSPQFSSDSKNGYFYKSFQNFYSDKEAATKWDLVYPKTSEGVSISAFNGYVKPREQQVSALAVVSVMELKLEQAQARIHELEHEQKLSKKKLESFLRKVSEEKAAWRSREHEKSSALLDDVKSDLIRERKYHQRAEIINSKLVNELAEAKLSVKRYMHEYEKERKKRELVEEVCEELAKEVEDDKEDAEAIRKEYLKIHEDVEDERKMLQMAEVWLEERVQMKLVDLKVMVEEKYSLMNQLVTALENFLQVKKSRF